MTRSSAPPAAEAAAGIAGPHTREWTLRRTGAAAMLTFLRANGGRTAISADHLAAMMIELQRRAESGEDVGRLVRSIAADLARRPPRSRRPR
ncbi:MAG: hypothetical protein DME12_04055 [Candidatus Rokuibacteriota bacterium]|nr:MAG: hypothetical protein DME12_04055 [Candidatus Rokubacteria bacterium]